MALKMSGKAFNDNWTKKSHVDAMCLAKGGDIDNSKAWRMGNNTIKYLETRVMARRNRLPGLGIPRAGRLLSRPGGGRADMLVGQQGEISSPVDEGG